MSYLLIFTTCFSSFAMTCSAGISFSEWVPLSVSKCCCMLYFQTSQLQTAHLTTTLVQVFFTVRFMIICFCAKALVLWLDTVKGNIPFPTSSYQFNLTGFFCNTHMYLWSKLPESMWIPMCFLIFFNFSLVEQTSHFTRLSFVIAWSIATASMALCVSVIPISCKKLLFTK